MAGYGRGNAARGRPQLTQPDIEAMKNYSATKQFRSEAGRGYPIVCTIASSLALPSGPVGLGRIAVEPDEQSGAYQFYWPELSSGPARSAAAGPLNQVFGPNYQAGCVTTLTFVRHVQNGIDIAGEQHIFLFRGNGCRRRMLETRVDGHLPQIDGRGGRGVGRP